MTLNGEFARFPMSSCSITHATDNLECSLPKTTSTPVLKNHEFTAKCRHIAIQQNIVFSSRRTEDIVVRQKFQVVS